ncbi:hypothetical protein O1L60_17400 [Streptomyces diastatochromogenes]|nr:hypothetical protein [Streptomyces diastatochromogenes]
MTTPTDTSPLPSSIPTVRVHGRYRGPDGRSLSGTVTFTPPGLLTFPASDLFIAGPVVAALDENGGFSVSLPATDAPDMNPSGWAWTVKENLAGVVGAGPSPCCCPRTSRTWTLPTWRRLTRPPRTTCLCPAPRSTRGAAPRRHPWVSITTGTPSTTPGPFWASRTRP